MHLSKAQLSNHNPVSQHRNHAANQMRRGAGPKKSWLFFEFSFHLLNSSLRQFDHQRRLLPQQIYTLLIPILTHFAKLHIEIPQHPRKDRAHLGVCQTKGGEKRGISRKHRVLSQIGDICSSRLSDAIPGTVGEGLTGLSLVARVEWIVEPAFRDEAFGVAEVGFG